ncbi:MAG: hypothetical protein QOH21_3463 [Acidobacteriota bacterium]|jgi:hypothetical protein|nr:hypothetical protein [Acidobacteriota bacterium]
MRRVLFVVVLALFTSTLFAAGWKKAYFGATPAGSWARYTDTAPDMKMTTTMSRLGDDDGRARVELLVAFANDQYPPVRNLYTMKSGFALDRQLIDYMSQIVEASAVSGEGEPIVLDANTVNSIVTHSPRYEPVVTFKGTETVAGREADRYAYTLRHAGTPETVETGDLWLSAGVPFGVVKHSSVTKDPKGKVTTSYERLLTATGAKPVAAAVAHAKAPAKKASQTLKEAYDAGLVRLVVTVAKGSANGERAHVSIEGKEDEPLTLVVPKGKTSLHVDIPLDDFVFEVPAAQTFTLDGEHTAELDVKQLGEQRAMDGQFTISTYEGAPLFSGSATVGWVKKK